jgi:hypothetical protein
MTTDAMVNRYTRGIHQNVGRAYRFSNRAQEIINRIVRANIQRRNHTLFAHCSLCRSAMIRIVAAPGAHRYADILARQFRRDSKTDTLQTTSYHCCSHIALIE